MSSESNESDELNDIDHLASSGPQQKGSHVTEDDLEEIAQMGEDNDDGAEAETSSAVEEPDAPEVDDEASDDVEDTDTATAPEVEDETDAEEASTETDTDDDSSGESDDDDSFTVKDLETLTMRVPQEKKEEWDEFKKRFKNAFDERNGREPPLNYYVYPALFQAATSDQTIEDILLDAIEDPPERIIVDGDLSTDEFKRIIAEEMGL